MSAQQARLDLNDPALHDGESGINVQCGQREHRSGGGLTPKKGIENHERKERGLAVIECSERWRDRCKRLMWTAIARRWWRPDAKEGHQAP